MSTNVEFLRGIFQDIPSDARVVVCGFEGDPTDPPQYAWAVKPVPPATMKGTRDIGPRALFAEDWNNYTAVSSFTRADGGDGKGPRFRRRKNQFAALHAVMVDDIGTGPGAKLDMNRLVLPPTALVETSPDNFQGWLRLCPPVTDRGQAERLIMAMIHDGFQAALDPGMAGVTRVGRLPLGVNGKRKYKGWNVRLASFAPSICYSAEEIIEAFGLDLDAVRVSSRRSRRHVSIEATDDPYLRVLSELKMVQGQPEKYEGTLRVAIACPWIEEHSDRADTGAAYFVGGGFRCHHAHGEELTFRDVKDWLRAECGIDTAALDRKVQRTRDRAILAKLRGG